MKLLAVIKDKNRCLKAYFPEVMSPYLALNKKFKELFGPQTFLMFESDLTLEEDVDANVGITENKKVVVLVSINNLITWYGTPSGVTNNEFPESMSWDQFLEGYSDSALMRSYEIMPYPAMTSCLNGYCVRGVTNAPDLQNGEVIYKYPNSQCYLDFGMNVIRPQAYTLDTYPGLTAHIGSSKYSGLIDETVYRHILTDIVIEKDVSCPVNLRNCVSIVNGLAYMSEFKNGRMYIKSAMEVVGHVSYNYQSVMLMDFSAFNPNAHIDLVKFSDCELVDISFDGVAYNITINLPDQYSFNDSTVMTWFDGRFLTFDKVCVIGKSSVCISVYESEIRNMRESDMYLTGNLEFNNATVKTYKSDIDWLNALFVEPKTESKDDTDLEEYERDSINTDRSFFSIIKTTGIYINDYLVDDKLSYNSLLTYGNIGGMLQNCRGKEIFEHVIVNYMDQHYLKHKSDSEKDIVYGSDAHLLGYAPYGFLTSLYKQKKFMYNTLKRSTMNSVSGSKQPQVAMASMPYIDRTAPDAIVPDNQLFRLLDIVKVK